MNDIDIKMNSSGERELESLAEDYLDKLAQKVLDKAVARCPVRTGALRDSLQIMKEDNDRIIGTDGSGYALFVEMGTRHQAPQSYLRSSLDEVIGGI